MRWLTAVALLGVALETLNAAPAKPKPSLPKSSKSSKVTASPPSHGKRHGWSAKQSRRPHLPPPPSYQLQPDPSRYQEIQGALAEKGYFKGDVNGSWGDDSIEALKQFQAQQGLSADGKLNALTLIGLGLGPKHDGSSMTAGTPAANMAPPE